jgi:hypothetical protein
MNPPLGRQKPEFETERRKDESVSKILKRADRKAERCDSDGKDGKDT